MKRMFVYEMKRLTIILMAVWGLCVGVDAQTKAEADSAYINEDYATAITLYNGLLEQGESAEVYYNLGNSYYKADSLAQAILSYERALLLEPGNDDIRFNLDMARSKTVDKVTPEREMFFVTWFNSLTDFTSADNWGYAAVVLFVLMLCSLMVYVMGRRIRVKKTGFIVAAFALLGVLLCNVFAYRQKSLRTHRTGAVVMANSVVVRSTPAESGTELFVLHEGTRVEIVEDTMREWKEIRLADGKQGWVPLSQIERI